jgi:membrane-bound serine protease (ClpP class)
MELELILVLSVVGLVLIAVDFYLPGFVLGSVGVVLMLVATVLCGQHHSLTVTALLFCAEVVAGFGAAWLSIKYFPQTKYGRKMILHETLEGAQASRNASADLVGREGTAQTVLRPTGVAVIDGKRLDVMAESGMIAAGNAIKVVAVEGTRVIVQKVS